MTTIQNDDPTEQIRRELVPVINKVKGDRETLEDLHDGKVWDTSELTRDFEVIGFMAPLVVVKRKADGVKGSLCFQHDPKFYFDFVPTT